MCLEFHRKEIHEMHLQYKSNIKICASPNNEPVWYFTPTLISHVHIMSHQYTMNYCGLKIKSTISSNGQTRHFKGLTAAALLIKLRANDHSTRLSRQYPYCYKFFSWSRCKVSTTWLQPLIAACQNEIINAQYRVSNATGCVLSHEQILLLTLKP